MRRSPHDILGCARGPVLALAPPARLVVGAAAFATCMVAPVAAPQGSLIAVGVTTAWLAACRVPFRILRPALLLGLALFLPYFLLVPLLPDALAVPWSLLVRGMTGMLVSLATVTSLSASDLGEALARLPIPSAVAAILLQVVHQSGTLFYETRRLAEAMAVRGAIGGALAGWRVLVSVPRVWLPRIADRAERVAEAMELRGFCDEEARPLRPVPFSIADVVAVAMSTVVLACVVALRLAEGV